MMSVIMLSVIMLSVIMLNVIMMHIMAPISTLKRRGWEYRQGLEQNFTSLS